MEIINGNGLLYKPKIHVMEGIMKKTIQCAHPDGNVYTVILPENKHKTIVVQGKGIKGGDLSIDIDWEWNMFEFEPLVQHLREVDAEGELPEKVRANIHRFLEN